METSRLRFRLIQQEDSAFLFELMNTHKWQQYIGDRGIDSEAAARQYIVEKMGGDLASKGFVNHVMIERTSGKKVGTCSLHDREGVDGLDIGYALLPAYEGKGYATDGARAMIKLAKEKYNQSNISAITSPENCGSSRLLEKLGFQPCKLIRLPFAKEDVRLYILEEKR